MDQLGKPVELPNGWVRVDAFIARTGIQIYERDGKEFREYRPPAEVFKADTLESFNSVPLTNNHPRVALDAHNTKAYQVGTVRDPKQDGTRTRAQLLITDAATIEDLRAGKTQISCGYTCDLDCTPGVSPEGEHYDAVQTNITGNHVAIVDEARGGPELRARMDSAGVLLDDRDRVDVTSTQHSTTHKASEVEIMEELKKALEAVAAEKARADAAEKKLTEIDAVKAELEKANARADMAEAEAKALPGKIAAQVKARAELETKARTVLGDSVDFTGKTDLEIKTSVVASHGTMKVDGRSEAYLDAAFDLVCDSAPRSDVGEFTTDDAADQIVDPVTSAKAGFKARLASNFQ